MDSKPEETKAYWLVGAAFGEHDQVSRFLQEGIWENGHQDEYLDAVKSIRVGDRIAIKAAYTRKHDLPFDNRGQIVPVMKIKAIGEVKDNPGNGHTLKVAWKSFDNPREWYFSTFRNTVHKLSPGNWKTDALIRFAFEGEEQDIQRFRNDPQWRERFGDIDDSASDFGWTGFYEAIADKLLTFRDRRDELVAGIHGIISKTGGSALIDQFSDGTSAPLKDICPFTTIGIFNRGMTDENRKTIARELAEFFKISEPIPKSLGGIPTLHNMKSWFFNYEKSRQPDDIDILWEVFKKAMALVETNDEEAQSEFVSAYNNAIQRHNVGWNLTMGLYWIRPWDFLSLDSLSRNYISGNLNIPIGKNVPSATDYLKTISDLGDSFQTDEFPVHSFPELSLVAWNSRNDEASIPPDAASPDTRADETGATHVAEDTAVPVTPYTIDDILKDGCFIDRNKLENILKRLMMKKNLILQGPPGTGKTWLAKRLAFALIEQRENRRVRAVQFHPNLSYEDFIRGWRPAGDGKLTLVDGPFMEMIKAAGEESNTKHVVVIEEINRGNPAQIFGEMLTLLEADKRNPHEALEISYGDERVFIPDNLYVIGTMNVADRSLALVDLALRRRFAFIELGPTFGKPWRDWVQSQCGIDSEILTEIEKRLTELNNEIESTPGLGPQFRVGHSYVTPASGATIDDARKWFRQVVETEIGPLLDEYWFDDMDKSKKAKENLLEGF